MGYEILKKLLSGSMILQDTYVAFDDNFRNKSDISKYLNESYR